MRVSLNIIIQLWSFWRGQWLKIFSVKYIQIVKIAFFSLASYTIIKLCTNDDNPYTFYKTETFPTIIKCFNCYLKCYIILLCLVINLDSRKSFYLLSFIFLVSHCAKAWCIMAYESTRWFVSSLELSVMKTYSNRSEEVNTRFLVSFVKDVYDIIQFIDYFFVTLCHLLEIWKLKDTIKHTWLKKLECKFEMIM